MKKPKSEVKLELVPRTGQPADATAKEVAKARLAARLAQLSPLAQDPTYPIDEPGPNEPARLQRSELSSLTRRPALPAPESGAYPDAAREASPAAMLQPVPPHPLRPVADPWPERPPLPPAPMPVRPAAEPKSQAASPIGALFGFLLGLMLAAGTGIALYIYLI
jgi:hypothetical protein